MVFTLQQGQNGFQVFISYADYKFLDSPCGAVKTEYVEAENPISDGIY